MYFVFASTSWTRGIKNIGLSFTEWGHHPYIIEENNLNVNLAG